MNNLPLKTSSVIHSKVIFQTEVSHQRKVTISNFFKGWSVVFDKGSSQNSSQLQSRCNISVGPLLVYKNKDIQTNKTQKVSL